MVKVLDHSFSTPAFPHSEGSFAFLSSESDSQKLSPDTDSKDSGFEASSQEKAPFPSSMEGLKAHLQTLPFDPLTELRQLLGPLVPKMLQDETDGLNLEMIPPSDFEGFKQFLITQLEVDGIAFNAWGLDSYHALLSSGEFDELVQVLWNNVGRTFRSAIPPEAGDNGSEAQLKLRPTLLTKFTAEVIEVSADRFVARNLHTDHGRMRILRILSDTDNFSRETRSDIVKAVAMTSRQQGYAALHAHLIEKDIPFLSWINRDLTEEEIARASKQSLHILEVVGEHEKETKAKWDRYLKRPEQVRGLKYAEKYLDRSLNQEDWDKLLYSKVGLEPIASLNPNDVGRVFRKPASGGRPAIPPEAGSSEAHLKVRPTANAVTTNAITAHDFQKMARLVEANKTKASPIAQMQSQLAKMWLLAADNDNWKQENSLGITENRADLINFSEHFLQASLEIKSDADLAKLSEDMLEYLEDNIAVSENIQWNNSFWILKLQDTVMGNNLQDLFQDTPTAIRSPFDDLKLMAEEIVFAANEDESLGVKTLNTSMGHAELDAQAQGLIQELNHLKRKLWHGYKSQAPLTRGSYYLLDVIGSGPKDDIRGANLALDGLIGQVQQARNYEDLQKIQDTLAKEHEGDGAIHLGLAAAESDYLDQMLHLMQTIGEMMVTTLVLRGVAGTASFARLKNAVTGAKGIQQSSRAARAGGFTRNIQLGGANTLLDQVAYGSFMGMAISIEEKALAQATGGITEGPLLSKGTAKDGLATAMAMGAFTPFIMRFGSFLMNGKLKPLFHDYKFAWAARRGTVLAGDIVLEGGEELFDASIRQSLDGRSASLSKDQVIEITKATTLGGGFFKAGILRHGGNTLLNVGRVLRKPASGGRPVSRPQAGTFGPEAQLKLRPTTLAALGAGVTTLLLTEPAQAFTKNAQIQVENGVYPLWAGMGALGASLVTGLLAMGTLKTNDLEKLKKQTTQGHENATRQLATLAKKDPKAQRALTLAMTAYRVSRAVSGIDDGIDIQAYLESGNFSPEEIEEIKTLAKINDRVSTPSRTKTLSILDGLKKVPPAGLVALGVGLATLLGSNTAQALDLTGTSQDSSEFYVNLALAGILLFGAVAWVYTIFKNNISKIRKDHQTRIGYERKPSISDPKETDIVIPEYLLDNPPHKRHVSFANDQLMTLATIDLLENPPNRDRWEQLDHPFEFSFDVDWGDIYGDVHFASGGLLKLEDSNFLLGKPPKDISDTLIRFRPLIMHTLFKAVRYIPYEVLVPTDLKEYENSNWYQLWFNSDDNIAARKKMDLNPVKSINKVSFFKDLQGRERLEPKEKLLLDIFDIPTVLSSVRGTPMMRIEGDTTIDLGIELTPEVETGVGSNNLKANQPYISFTESLLTRPDLAQFHGPGIVTHQKPSSEPSPSKRRIDDVLLNIEYIQSKLVPSSPLQFVLIFKDGKYQIKQGEVKQDGYDRLTWLKDFLGARPKHIPYQTRLNQKILSDEWKTLKSGDEISFGKAKITWVHPESTVELPQDFKIPPGALLGLAVGIATLFTSGPAEAMTQIGTAVSENVFNPTWMGVAAAIGAGIWAATKGISKKKNELRDYQKEMLQGLERDSDEKVSPWFGIASPMQTGKSHLIGPIIMTLEYNYKNPQIIVLSSSRVITDQLMDDLSQNFPGETIGRFDGIVKEPNRITVASAMSLARNLSSFDKQRPVILINDEGFYTQAGSWRKIISHFGLGELYQEGEVKRIKPKAGNGVLVGLSGTGNGLEEYHISGEMTLIDAIDQGWVREMIGERVYPTGSFKKQKGSFGNFETWWEPNEDNAEELVELFDQRIKNHHHKSLIFVPTIRHGKLIRQVMERRYGKGYVQLVHSRSEEMKDKDFFAALEKYNEMGGALISIQRLSRGFRATGTDAIFHTYQTQSSELFSQRTGRGWGVGDGTLDPLYVLEATWSKNPQYSNLGRLLGFSDYPMIRMETKKVKGQINKIKHRQEKELEQDTKINEWVVSPLFQEIPLLKSWERTFQGFIKQTGSLKQLSKVTGLEMTTLEAFALGVLPFTNDQILSLSRVIGNQEEAHGLWVELWETIVDEAKNNIRSLPDGLSHQLFEWREEKQTLHDKINNLEKILITFRDPKSLVVDSTTVQILQNSLKVLEEWEDTPFKHRYKIEKDIGYGFATLKIGPNVYQNIKSGLIPSRTLPAIFRFFYYYFAGQLNNPYLDPSKRDIAEQHLEGIWRSVMKRMDYAPRNGTQKGEFRHELQKMLFFLPLLKIKTNRDSAPYRYINIFGEGKDRLQDYPFIEDFLKGKTISINHFSKFRDIISLGFSKRLPEIEELLRNTITEETQTTWANLGSSASLKDKEKHLKNLSALTTLSKELGLESSWESNEINFAPADLLQEDDILDYFDLKRSLPQVLRSLSPKEEKTLRLHYFDGFNYSEIGNQFKINRERVRQIWAKALRKLHHPSRKDFLPFRIDRFDPKRSLLFEPGTFPPMTLEALNQAGIFRIKDLPDTILEEINLLSLGDIRFIDDFLKVLSKNDIKVHHQAKSLKPPGFHSEHFIDLPLPLLSAAFGQDSFERSFLAKQEDVMLSELVRWFQQKRRDSRKLSPNAELIRYVLEKKGYSFSDNVHWVQVRERPDGKLGEGQYAPLRESAIMALGDNFL